MKTEAQRSSNRFKLFDSVTTEDGDGTIISEGVIAPDRYEDENGPIHEPVYRVRFRPHSWSYYKESEIKFRGIQAKRDTTNKI